MSLMSASANRVMRLNKTGVDRFVKLKARNLISGVMDAMLDELAGRGDLDVKTSSIRTTATSVSAELRVKARQGDIREEELGTESRSPAHTVGRLVKDPSVRTRIMRKAARSL